MAETVNFVSVIGFDKTTLPISKTGGLTLSIFGAETWSWPEGVLFCWMSMISNSFLICLWETNSTQNCWVEEPWPLALSDVLGSRYIIGYSRLERLDSASHAILHKKRFFICVDLLWIAEHCKSFFSCEAWAFTFCRTNFHTWCFRFNCLKFFSILPYILRLLEQVICKTGCPS